MYSQETQWRISKYRQLKGFDQSEVKDATLLLDISKKIIGVYSGGTEKENISFDLPGKQYPKLKFKEMSLYVVVNYKFEGFRITFFPEDKEKFLNIMRNFITVSEGTRPNSSEKRRENTSMPPPERFAPRSLSTNYFDRVHNMYATPEPKVAFSQPLYNPYTNQSPHGSSSQPVYNPYASSNPFGAYSQPTYNPYATSSPMGIQQPYTTSYAEDPFAVFDSYPGSRLSSPAGSISSNACSIRSQHSTSFPHQEPSFSSSPHFLSPAPQTPSLLPTPAPAPLTPKPAPITRVDRSMQTDDLTDQMTANPTFMLSCLQNLMKNRKFQTLVASTRTEVREMSEKRRNKLYRDTNPILKRSRPSLPATSQPPSLVHHGNSDLEFEAGTSKKL